MSATKDVFVLATTGRPFAAMLGGMALACLSPAAVKVPVNENVILSIPSDRVIGLAICSAGQYKKIR
jgi:hypothetical protein